MINHNDELEKSIENNLYELFVKNFEYARDMEVFSALAYSIRQKIGKAWFKTLKEYSKEKRLYILSFEYSFNNQLIRNLIKLNLLEDTKNILNKNNISFESIKSQDIEFPLGFSDLGEVSSELLELFASLKSNVYSYGLRYRRGMLKQEIINGEQIEKPDDWKVNKNPWEHEKGFFHIVKFKDSSVKAIPYDLPILSNDGNHVNTLRLWKSFSINNLDFNEFSKGNILGSYNEINKANSIVEFLYPNENNDEGKKLRLMQEYFFASACIQDILKKYKKYTDNNINKIYEKVSIQVNDVHPIFSILVFIDLLMKKYSLSFENSIEIAKKTFIFLHLSILPESFEKWDLNLLSEICPDLINVINKLDYYVKNELTQKNKKYAEALHIISNGKVDMVNIAYYISRNILTLTKNYLDLIKDKYMINQYDYYKFKIKNINLQFDAKQYLKEINIEKNRTYNHLVNNTIDKLNADKLNNKKNLIEYLDIDSNLININAPFVMHLGVFHEYKRQILSILGVAYQYFQLKLNPNLDIPERTYIYAGKSYPNYYIAKETIKFINALANQVNNDLFIKDKIKILFIENYDNRKSDIILPACDINQKLDIISLQDNEINLMKSILCGANIVTSNSSYNSLNLSEDNLELFLFGDYKEAIINDTDEYKMHDYLIQNPEITEMFNYYRGLPKTTFPYDIDEIFNSIYYYNDEYKIFKDLFEYVYTMELAIKEYTNSNFWREKIVKNISTIISSKEYIALNDYTIDLGAIDD